MNLPGVNQFTSAEYGEKETAIEGAPRALLSIVKSQIEGEYQLVDLSNYHPEIELAFQIDAMSHLLALLNFPDKLRGFLDCLLGLAKYEAGYEFAATNWEVGLRSRSGRAACSDESMEKWVARKKQSLEEWMAAKSFRFVKITKGSFNWETNRNEPTRYQVFFNRYVVETVRLAKTLFYWRDGNHYARFQGRALREAARKVLQRIPEAPPLKPAKIKILSEDVKFDRRHKTIISFLEKNRDVLAAMNLAHEEYFMYLVQKVIDPLAFNPTGTTGALLTPDADQPDRRGGILRRIERGTLFAEELGYTGDDQFAETVSSVMGDDSPFVSDEKTSAEQPKMPENDRTDKNVPPCLNSDVLNTSESSNSLNTNVKHGGTFLSGTGGQNEIVKHFEGADGETNLSAGAIDDFDLQSAFDDFEEEYMDAKEVQAIVENWKREVARKVPPISSEQRFSGAWEISWQSFGGEAARTENALNFAILKTSRSSQSISGLRDLFINFVMARIAYVKGGVPVPLERSKLDKMRERLTEILAIPDVNSS